jgi:tetratricopeptide (TPR) repeat protein
LTPEQAAQAEIRQLNASIESGSISGDDCLNALRRRGYLHATSGAGGLARRDLDAVIAVNPGDRDAHFFKALSHFIGAARLALPSFTRAIELRPDDAEGYAGRGWASLVEGKYKEAAGDFGQVLRLAPGDAEGLRGRAWASVHTGDYDRAIADIDALLKASRGQPEALALRGAAHYLAGRGDQARLDLRSAMRFRPVPNRARTYGSVRLDNWRRYGALQQVVEARVKQNPRDITGLLVSGVLVFRAYDDGAPGGLMRIASDGFTRALAIEPASIDALMMRAATCSAPLYGYRYETAIADLSEVIRLDANYAEAYFQRALVRAADQPSLPLAIADAEKALSLVPGDRVLVALVNKLKADRVAYEAEKSRLAEARAQRAAALQRAKEQAAAIFLAGFAVGIANADGTPASPEELRRREENFMLDWLWDLTLKR